MKNFITGLLKGIFAFVLMYWLYQKGVLDFKVLKPLLNPVILIVALGGLILNFYFATIRWQRLLKIQKIHLSLGACFKLNLVGLFFNYVMPGGVGGDVVKAYYIVKDHPQNRMGAGVSVLVDRVMGLYAMLLLALGAMAYSSAEISQNPQLLLMAKTLILGFILFNLGLILSFSEKFRSAGWQNWLLKYPSIGKKLVDAYESIYSYSHDLGTLGLSVVLSLLAQTVAVLIFLWLGQNLGFAEIPSSIYFSAVPIGFIITAVPISPAGIGVGQMAFYFLFNVFMGKDSQVGPSLITSFQLLNFILGLSGVWFYIQRKDSWKDAHAVGS